MDRDLRKRKRSEKDKDLREKALRRRDAREAGRHKLRKWMDEHTERLGVSEDEIWNAVTRGWFGEDVEALPAVNASRLAGPPPHETLRAVVLAGSAAEYKAQRREVGG